VTTAAAVEDEIIDMAADLKDGEGPAVNGGDDVLVAGAGTGTDGGNGNEEILPDAGGGGNGGSARGGVVTTESSNTGGTELGFPMVAVLRSAAETAAAAGSWEGDA
jgi:hypothetical protein